MAYLLDDEEQKQQQQAAAPGPEQVMTGPSSGVIAPGASGGGATSQAPAQKAGGNVGGFTNLQSYVTANQGNDQAMGQKVSGVVDQSAKASDAAVSNFSGAGKNEVAGGTVNFDPNLANQIYTDPLAITKDANKTKAYQGQLNATYGGPSSAADVSGYQDADKANRTVTEDLTSARGDNVARQSLLDKSYGRSGYSAGEKGLDSFLLGAGSGGRQALNDIQTNYGNRVGQFQKAADDIDKQIGDGQATTADTRTKANAVLQEAGAGREAYFDQQAATAKQNADKSSTEFQKILSYLKNPAKQVRDQAFKEIGIDPSVGEDFIQEGGDVSALISMGAQKSLGDYLRPDQVAQYKALQSLGYGGRYYDGDFVPTGGNGNVYDVTDRARDHAKYYESKLAGQKAAEAAAEADRNAKLAALRQSIPAQAPVSPSPAASGKLPTIDFAGFRRRVGYGASDAAGSAAEFARDPLGEIASGNGLGVDYANVSKGSVGQQLKEYLGGKTKKYW